MNEQQREILSAYFDSEATGEECAEAERLLRDSAAARAQWQSFQSVAERLRSLPRRTLPDEFRVAVMQRAERASLLPPAEVVQPAGPRRTGRWWLRSTMGTVAAIAVLVLIAVPYWGNGPEDSSERSLPTTAGTRESIDVAAMQSVSDGDRPASSVAPQDELIESAVALSTAAVPTEQAPEIQTEADHLVFDTKSLTQVEIGDIVEALDGSGDDVSVVHLTVVDREQGLSALKLILRECRIEEDAPPSLVGNERDAAEPGMMAVYVESPREHLAAALQHLNRAPFEEVAVAESIQVAELDSQSQAQLGITAGANGLERRQDFAGVAQTQRGAPAADDRAESDRAKTPATAKQTAEADEQQDGKQSAGVGRQRSVILPSVVLADSRGARQMQKRKTTVPPPALPERAGEPVSQEPGTFEVAEADASSAAADAFSDEAKRPMQVIFVLMSRRPSRPGGGAPAVPVDEPGPVPPRNPGAA